MLFKVDFITYEGVYRTIETEKLNIPTTEGRRTILSNHMPIIIPLSIGVIETANGNEVSQYAVNNGVLYFKNNVAEIVADSVIDVEDIKIDEILKEKAEAEEKIRKARREYEKIRSIHKIDVANNLIKADKQYNHH